MAAQGDNLSLLSTMLKTGKFEVNAQNQTGATPLYMAGYSVVKYAMLMDAKANPEIPNRVR